MSIEKPQIKPFSNATEFGCYLERNCYNCLNCLDNKLGEAEELFHKGECKIYENIMFASVGSGEIPLEIAQIMGYENNKIAAKCKKFVRDSFEYVIISGNLFEKN